MELGCIMFMAMRGNYVSAFVSVHSFLIACVSRNQHEVWGRCGAEVQSLVWNGISNMNIKCVISLFAETCANKLMPYVLISYLCTSFLLAHIHEGKTFVIHQFTVRNFIHETFMLKPFYCVLIDC